MESSPVDRQHGTETSAPSTNSARSNDSRLFVAVKVISFTDEALPDIDDDAVV